MLPDLRQKGSEEILILDGTAVMQADGQGMQNFQTAHNHMNNTKLAWQAQHASHVGDESEKELDSPGQEIQGLQGEAQQQAQDEGSGPGSESARTLPTRL